MGASNSLVRAAAVVGLLVHLDGHSAASGHVALGGDGGGSGVASQVLGGDILNGRVAQGDTRTRGVEVRSVNLCALLVTVLGLQIINSRKRAGQSYPKLLEGCVGNNVLCGQGSGQRSGKGVLHLDGILLGSWRAK